MEYETICWAAACLVFWAGGDGNLAVKAADMVCDRAGLTVPQEAALKREMHKMMTKKEVDDGADR